jgi:hypothetical protein
MMLFNPTGNEIRKVIDVPLYYTGKTSTVKIREKEGAVQNYTLDRSYAVKVPVVLKPYSYSWWIVE